MLEGQIEVDRQKHEELVKQEQSFFAKETEKLKTEHSSIVNALLDRNSAQAKEIQGLHVRTS